MYDRKEYATSLFCEIFLELYYFENSGYKLFDKEERTVLDQLAMVVERFSPYENEIIEFPNTYIGENVVREKFEEVYGKLKKCNHQKIDSDILFL